MRRYTSRWFPLGFGVSALLLLGAAVASGRGEPFAAKDPSVLVLPSETCRGFIILPVNLDGTTLELLFDTGSSWTFIAPEALDRVLGRKVKAGTAEFAAARIGGHDLGRLRARVYPMKTLGRAVGRPIDGILGFPAFKEVLLTLDYPASEVRVEAGRLPRPDGREIFRDLGRKRPVLELDLGARKVKVLLDSGAVPGYLKLKTGDPVQWLAEPRPAQAVALFNGVALRPGGRVRGNLGLGPVEIRSPVAFVDGAERLVGWQIMRHFSLTFDQRSKRIRMVAASDAREITTAPYVHKGFATRPRPQGLEVIQVFAETAAAKSGLRAGDLIVAIDGTPVYERRCTSFDGVPEGAEIRLSTLRDGVAAELEIRTVTLVP